MYLQNKTPNNRIKTARKLRGLGHATARPFMRNVRVFRNIMSDIIGPHKHSSNHREELMQSRLCGCFYCLSIFEPSAITDWVDWPPDTPEEDELDKGTTALCPKCGIDSVIGDKSGYPIEKKFLEDMKRHWFDK